MTTRAPVVLTNSWLDFFTSYEWGKATPAWCAPNQQTWQKIHLTHQKKFYAASKHISDIKMSQTSDLNYSWKLSIFAGKMGTAFKKLVLHPMFFLWLDFLVAPFDPTWDKHEMELCDINSIFIKIKRWLSITIEKYATSALDDFAKSLWYNLMLSNEQIL